MSTWVNNIDYIEDGVDVVRADDTNRPLEQLDNRTQYLFDAIQTQSLGELIVARNVTFDAALVPGTPVWFDTSDSLWKAAEAILDLQEGNDFGFAAEESEVRGLVLVNHLGTGTTGDIALYGRIRTDWNIDWTEVTQEDAGSSSDPDTVPARYYLSVDAGKITRTRNVLSVEIGTLAADGSMVFTPNITGNLRNHLHLRFELSSAVVALGGDGWTVAASFSSAPVGATYGYNVAQDIDLAAKFPPMPLDNYFMTYNGVGLSRETIVVDNNGIWWMDATAPNVLGAHVYTAGVDDYFEFWMMQLNFGAKIVNSLQGGKIGDVANTIQVKVQDLTGSDTDNGDLQLYIDESIKTQVALTDESVYALKQVDGVKGYRGPVLSRLVPGAGVTLSSLNGNATDGFFGQVSVSSTAALASVLNGNPTLVALSNAREDFFNQNVPVLNLPRNRISSFKLKIPVPSYLPANLSVSLRLGVTAATAFGATTVQLYTLVVTPDDVIPSAPVLDQNMAISITPGNQNRLKLFTSAAITGLQPGDILFVDVSKDAVFANDIMFAVVDYTIAVSA